MNFFKQNTINIYGKKGELWLEVLPHLVKTIAADWGLSSLSPIENLSYNYVLSGFFQDQPIILKLSLDFSGLEKEGAALQAFAGFGGAAVLKQAKGALLLERAVPGLSLKSYFPSKEDEAIKIATNIMKKLHSAPLPQNAEFPHISDWLKKLDQEWDIPVRYLEKARALRGHLLASGVTQALLHGDLHHDNILAHGGDWLVIDPKGVVGEEAYEVGAFIRNPIPNLLQAPNHHEIINHRIVSFARLLTLPEKRIVGWSFVQTILSWIWNIEDGLNTEYFQKLSLIFDQRVE